MSNLFVSELEGLGYFKGLTGEKAQNLKRDFESNGWLAIFSDSHRLFMADAEDLAEGGIGQFIQNVEPFLATQGVKLPAIEDDISPDGYTVIVDGVAHEIYDAEELERDSSKDQGGLIWGLSMARGFSIIDRLLASAGSKERPYAVNGGNDLFVLFLTPELHRTIMRHPDATRCDGPYVPTEVYPSFGQPEDDACP
jgi:hypothetical protein